ENISNREQFQQRLKYDITKEYVDLLEIGQLKDIDSHLNIIFPATGLDNPLIICSDNHDVNDYQIKVPLWLKADPTFRGLLMVLHEPQSRVFIGDQPEQFRRIEQNSTKYIKSITIRRKEDAPESESWFDNTIILNPDLVAIIGNKGSGKSALADTLGLLGSTKNWGWFSFLSDERFCHLTAGHADHYEATLEWASGEKTTRCLADKIKPEEVERIKYLPQDHVERICNEIVGIGEERFEKELESVIFSHVPEAQRLGNRTFDKLVQFKTGEKQNRIDSIIKQLQEVCRERAALELEDDPKVKRELTEKIKQRRIELEAHDRIKPEEVPNPSLKNGEDEAGSNLLKSLQTKEEAKKKVVGGIATTKEILRNSERHLAISNRLIEKIENFKKEFDAFKNSLEEEAIEVGLKAEDLITFSSNLQPIQKIKEEAINTIKTKNALLNDVEPPGLIKQLENIEGEIAELHSKLDAPNRAYQAYLKELEDWQLRRSFIVGTEADPDSLNGLQSTLASLDHLPSNISKLKDQQVELALQILAEKLAQVSVFRELYGPVQSFIDSHALVKDKLKLEFRAELTNDGFTDRLLGLLALNRRGSFMGIDEGRDRSEELVKITNWDEADSVKVFLGKVDDALHQDLREKPPTKTQLKDQTLQRNHPAEIFSLLYGLEYIRPKYVLRWEGKDLSML
ncbi:hypothetical protein KA005_53975, partial [bacterium]|nr:hypothetical protein [bacterium]